MCNWLEMHNKGSKNVEWLITVSTETYLNHTVQSNNVSLRHFVEQVSCNIQATTFCIHFKNWSCKNVITIRCHVTIKVSPSINVSTASKCNQSIENGNLSCSYPAIKQVKTTTFHLGLLSNSFNAYSISAHETYIIHDAIMQLWMHFPQCMWSESTRNRRHLWSELIISLKSSEWTGVVW